MDNFERAHRTRISSPMSASDNESCDHRDQPLFKVFRTLTTLLGAVGVCVYVNPCDPWYRKALAYFRRIYAILIFIFLCWSAFSSVFSWIRLTKLDVIHTQAVMFTLWILMACGSFFFLLYWQFRDRFIVHGRLLMEATGQAGIRRHGTLVLACSWAMAVWVVVISIFYPWVVIVQGNLLTFILSYASMQYEKMNYLLIFGFCYGVFAWASAVSIFTFICLCDFLEFRHFNKSLRKLDVRENFDQLYQHIDQFYKLLIAVDHTNRTFRIFALFSFATAIPNAILVIYSLLINKMKSLDLALSLVSLAVVIIHFVLVTVIPAAINEQAAKSSKAVYKKIRPLDFDDEDHQIDFQRLNWFAMHAANRPVGISIGPFFLITNNLLLTVISLIITYLTLLPYNSAIDDIQCSKNATVPL